MKWTYSIKNKWVASGSLFFLCVLVLFSNYIDRNHTENVKKAISTLYEDRLVAEGYILKMTSGMYQIIGAMNADASDDFKETTINTLLSHIKIESDAYQKTKFTLAEKSKANELLQVVKEFELIPINQVQAKVQSANQALALLNELSIIQLDESRQIMHHAEALYLSGKTSSEFVFAIIIIILIVLQALVFASKTLVPTVKTEFPQHN